MESYLKPNLLIICPFYLCRKQQKTSAHYYSYSLRNLPSNPIFKFNFRLTPILMTKVVIILHLKFSHLKLFLMVNTFPLTLGRSRLYIIIITTSRSKIIIFKQFSIKFLAFSRSFTSFFYNFFSKYLKINKKINLF